MFLSLSSVLFFLGQYKYLLIFPIVILEGPIVTVISGFLSYLGILNIYVAFTLLAIGDLIGDVLHYLIGKYWGRSSWVKKYGHFLGYDEKSEVYLENHFKKHKIKTVLSAKFLHGIGTAIQITAGIARVDFLSFLWISLIGTIPKTLILFLLGYYIGGSYIKIHGYLNIMAFVTIGVLIIILLYFILNKYIKNYFVGNNGVE